VESGFPTSSGQSDMSPQGATALVAFFLGPPMVLLDGRRIHVGRYVPQFCWRLSCFNLRLWFVFLGFFSLGTDLHFLPWPALLASWVVPQFPFTPFTLAFCGTPLASNVVLKPVPPMFPPQSFCFLLFFAVFGCVGHTHRLAPEGLPPPYIPPCFSGIFFS